MIRLIILFLAVGLILRLIFGFGMSLIIRAIDKMLTGLLIFFVVKIFTAMPERRG